jgi:hypothetical protein
MILPGISRIFVTTMLNNALFHQIKQGWSPYNFPLITAFSISLNIGSFEGNAGG